MIHTLLPTEDKKALRHEYHIRVLIVFFFMLSIAVLIGIVSLFPSFVKIWKEEGTVTSNVQSLAPNKTVDLVLKIEKELDEYSALLEHLRDETSSDNLSQVVSLIVRSRDSVKIGSISLSRPATTTVAVSLSGISPSREALLDYKKELEDAGFKVDLPISELAKSKNFQFNLGAEYKMP